MIFNILTLFPSMFDSYFKESILKRALDKGLIKINIYNIRDYATDKHRVTDDTPYGGGPGMVMKVEPIYRCLQTVPSPFPSEGKGAGGMVLLTSARGTLFTQDVAKRLAKNDTITIICGRYEGVDQRVADNLCDEEVSVGPYVLSGGELPAMTMIDAISRLIPGVLGNEDSLTEESHNTIGKTESPQYTKPEIFNGWAVPKELLSGDPKKIEAWKKNCS